MGAGVKQRCIQSPMLFPLASTATMRRPYKTIEHDMAWTLASIMEDYTDDLPLHIHTAIKQKTEKDDLPFHIHTAVNQKTENPRKTTAIIVGLKLKARKTSCVGKKKPTEKLKLNKKINRRRKERTKSKQTQTN